MKIKVKRIRKNIEFPTIINKGEWIDLRNAEKVSIDKGTYGLIPLNVCMQLPKGYEAIVTCRSSTPKSFGIMCANSFGIIDNSYSGNNDEWKFLYYGIRNCTIPANSRICQFRIQLSQKATVWQKLKWLFNNKIELIEVDNLNTINRGGIGSTGKK